MNHRALPVLVAALLILGGLAATMVVRGAEINTLVGVGIGAALAIVLGSVVAVAT